jgi:N-formylglutamate amidohydrolase
MKLTGISRLKNVKNRNLPSLDARIHKIYSRYHANFRRSVNMLPMVYPIKVYSSFHTIWCENETILG